VDGKLHFGEAYYFFQLKINNSTEALALVSVFSDPNAAHLTASKNTVWSSTYHGDAALKVINVKCITAVVSMIPHELPEQPGIQRWFVMEMPGLDAAQMGGNYEALTEE
jgi:hypothetical protein